MSVCCEIQQVPLLLYRYPWQYIRVHSLVITGKVSAPALLLTARSTWQYLIHSTNHTFSVLQLECVRNKMLNRNTRIDVWITGCFSIEMQLSFQKHCKTLCQSPVKWYWYYNISSETTISYKHLRWVDIHSYRQMKYHVNTVTWQKHCPSTQKWQKLLRCWITNWCCLFCNEATHSCKQRIIPIDVINSKRVNRRRSLSKVFDVDNEFVPKYE